MSTISNPTPAPQPSLSKWFETADTNSDQILSLDEVKAIGARWVNEHLASGAIKLESPRWHDANGDGGMSLAEFEVAQSAPVVYKLKHGQIGLDGETLSYRISDLFSFADQLGGVVDELITADEAEALGLDFFTFHDDNGDGLMSREEYENHDVLPFFGSAEQIGSITELRVAQSQLKTDLAKYIFGRLVRGDSVTEEELRYLESDEGSENLFEGDDWDTWMRFTQVETIGTST